MDIAKEQTEISDRIRRVPSSDARERLEAELSSLVAQYSAATTPEARAPIEARLAQFRRDVEIASGVSLWSLATMVFVGFVTFVYLLGIFLYMRGIGSDRYASIEATRPILVFTLIVAMLGFGGLLIGRALFSDEPHDQFQNRFRHAREIFLVFAGIFGTIIGFYFGASDDDAAAAQGVPAIEVATAANRTVEVTVTNGAEPFMGMLELADGAGAAALTADGRKLTTQLGPDQCPSRAKIRIVDGRGRRAEAEIAEKPDALNKQGWKCPPDGTEPDNATAPADNPSNATNEALPTNEEAAQDPVT